MWFEIPNCNETADSDITIKNCSQIALVNDAFESLYNSIFEMSEKF